MKVGRPHRMEQKAYVSGPAATSWKTLPYSTYDNGWAAWGEIIVWFMGKKRIKKMFSFVARFIKKHLDNDVMCK